MKKFLSWQFLVTLILSILVFEGLEHMIEHIFGYSLAHTLSFGGVGVWLVLGFKFHIFCHVLPAIGGIVFHTLRHKKCEHHEEK